MQEASTVKYNFLNSKIHQWHKALWGELALWVTPTSKI